MGNIKSLKLFLFKTFYSLFQVTDMSIHDSIAVFTAILIARHCFSLQDLVVHVVLPSLINAARQTQTQPGML